MNKKRATVAVMTNALHLLYTRNAHQEQFMMESVSVLLFERGKGVEGRAYSKICPNHNGGKDKYAAVSRVVFTLVIENH